ncbi:MAG: polyprenyl synthetase family protein [Firmicutes bacterium]|nr:polyprenyl synthetase family protein [Bacillota bacterium]
MSEKMTDRVIREALEKELFLRIHKGEGADRTLWEAMEYSLMAGGKRVRPMLLIYTGLSLGAPMELLMPFACSLEMIHTSSLIHDDLPAMDNDDYRRGRLTNHKVYGEAAAILAGDGLLNLAYETMADNAAKADPAVQGNAVRAMAYIAACAGSKGMMAGQIADLESEDKQISAEELTYIEFNKTSRLLMAAMKGGALLAGADDEMTERLEKAAGKVGLAFQIQDDVLDVEGSFEKLGKPLGSDEKSQKSTFVSLYGISEAKARVKELSEEAMQLLQDLPEEEGEYVRKMIRQLQSRDH